MFDLLHTFNSLFWRVYLTIHHCFIKLYWRTTEPFDIHLLCEFVCNRFTQFNLVPSLTKIMKPNRHSIILIKKHFHFILCNTSFKDYWQKFWLCTFSFFVLEASLWIIDINLIYLFNIKSKGENFELSNQHFIMLNSKKPFFVVIDQEIFVPYISCKTNFVKIGSLISEKMVKLLNIIEIDRRWTSKLLTEFSHTCKTAFAIRSSFTVIFLLYCICFEWQEIKVT